MVTISTITNDLPLNVRSVDSIARSLANTVGFVIPPHPPVPYASSPRKVHIRSAVSLASGHVLDYVHALQHHLEHGESYDEIDEIINNCIKALVDKPEPHTWMHCDAIAMAFWYVSSMAIDSKMHVLISAPALTYFFKRRKCIISVEPYNIRIPLKLQHRNTSRRM